MRYTIDNEGVPEDLDDCSGIPCQKCFIGTLIYDESILAKYNTDKCQLRNMYWRKKYPNSKVVR